MGYIYKITNRINNKMYIGKTEQYDPIKRWEEHLKDYKKRKNENRPLYKAMEKYGVDNFVFEIIEETNDAENREKYWIDKMRTYIGFKDCNGYNATLGGDGKSYLNLNENEVIKFHIEKSKNVLGNTAKNFKVDNRTIKKILTKYNVPYLSNKEVKDLEVYIKYGGVIQVDKNSKLILNKFKNAQEASQEIGVKKYIIQRACLNDKHESNGFLWFYGKDLEKEIGRKNIIC